MHDSVSIRPGSNYISVSGSGICEFNYSLDAVDVIIRTITWQMENDCFTAQTPLSSYSCCFSRFCLMTVVGSFVELLPTLFIIFLSEAIICTSERVSFLPLDHF